MTLIHQDGARFFLTLWMAVRADIYTAPIAIEPRVIAEPVLMGNALVCDRPTGCCMYEWQWQDWGWIVHDSCAAAPEWRKREWQAGGHIAIVLEWDAAFAEPANIHWWSGDMTTWRHHETVWAGPADWEADGDVDIFDLLAYMDDWWATAGQLEDLLTYLEAWFA